FWRRVEPQGTGSLRHRSEGLLQVLPVRLAMTRRAFGFLLLAVACKEAPIGGSPDARNSSLAGTWQGVQSIEPNGQGNLAKMVLENAPGGQVRGVLQVSETGPNDLGTIGHLAGPAQGGTFSRGPLLPDGGFATQYTLSIAAS